MRSHSIIADLSDDHPVLLTRSGKTCAKCGEPKKHGPTIGVAVVLGLIVVGLVLKRSLLKATYAFKFLKQMRLTGKVKFKVLFFALQVDGWPVCRWHG